MDEVLKNKIRYPGLLDFPDKLCKLKAEVEKHKDVKIIEISQSMIALSIGNGEFEYDCYEDAFEDIEYFSC